MITYIFSFHVHGSVAVSTCDRGLVHCSCAFYHMRAWRLLNRGQAHTLRLHAFVEIKIRPSRTTSAAMSDHSSTQVSRARSEMFQDQETCFSKCFMVRKSLHSKIIAALPAGENTGSGTLSARRRHTDHQHNLGRATQNHVQVLSIKQSSVLPHR